jgi:hypothetical protein
MARTEPWRVTDEFWEKVRPLSLPHPPTKRAAGDAWTTVKPSLR